VIDPIFNPTLDTFQVTSKRFSIAKAFKAMKHTYQTEGLAALYRGNSATMVRIIPYASIQYMAFEQYKKVALEYHHHELTPFLRFLCGGAAGATSVAATYPLDLMRARLGMHFLWCFMWFKF
jgi:solute carrier family 25 protein 42